MLPSPESARSEDFAELPASQLPAQALRHHNSSESCFAVGLPRHLPYTPFAPSEGFPNSKAGFYLNIKGKVSLCKQRDPKGTESGRRETKRPSAQASPRPLCPQRWVLLSCIAHRQHGGIGFLPQTSREMPVPCFSLQSPGAAGFGGLPGHPPHPSVPTTEGTTTSLEHSMR